MLFERSRIFPVEGSDTGAEIEVGFVPSISEDEPLIEIRGVESCLVLEDAVAFAFALTYAVKQCAEWLPNSDPSLLMTRSKLLLGDDG